MSLAEILEELPKLTLEERAEIFRHIEALDTDAEIELSEEALAAFDEGIHSIETEPSFTAEEVHGMLAQWRTASK
jgi:hypothetical protein